MSLNCGYSYNQKGFFRAFNYNTQTCVKIRVINGRISSSIKGSTKTNQYDRLYPFEFALNDMVNISIECCLLLFKHLKKGSIEYVLMGITLDKTYKQLANEPQKNHAIMKKIENVIY